MLSRFLKEFHKEIIHVKLRQPIESKTLIRTQKSSAPVLVQFHRTLFYPF